MVYVINSELILTIYNTVILVRFVIKFLDRHFLFIEKVQAFLDLILSWALARDKIRTFEILYK